VCGRGELVLVQLYMHVYMYVWCVLNCGHIIDSGRLVQMYIYRDIYIEVLSLLLSIIYRVFIMQPRDKIFILVYISCWVGLQ
jgi:hypothetical protein